MNWFKDTMNESRQAVVVHFEAAAYPIQLFLPFICKKYASLKSAFSDYNSQYHIAWFFKTLLEGKAKFLGKEAERLPFLHQFCN